MLCPWQELLPHIASASNVPGFGQCPLEWPAMQQGAAATEPSGRGLPINVLWDSSVALGRPLQDLDVRALEESRHRVRFLARSIISLEDK